MKISIALLVTVFAQEEATQEVAQEEAEVAAPAAEESAAESGEDIARFYLGSDGYDTYDYYYDENGRKKKKNKGNKNNNGGNMYGSNNGGYDSNYGYVNNNNGYGSNYGSQAAWADAYDTGSNFGYGKGYEMDINMIGNGRYCWNCFARLHRDPVTYQVTTAYDNCFGGINDGFMEMCVGEEYYCSWEERRYKGVIMAVQGGCKSAHSCLRQMTENFRWSIYEPGYPKMVGNLCKAGNFGDETLNSVCAWCCDAMPSNLDRYNPDTTMLCNHKDFTLVNNPAYEYFTNGDTNNFVWNEKHGESGAKNDIFNGLYQDGQFHGLFRIHDQYPLGAGNLANMYPNQRAGPAYDDKLRSHPREWTGEPQYLRGHNRFGQ